MKKVLMISFVFVSSLLQAQVVSKDDISFKAKLLTVFRLGVASPETVLRDLRDQQLTFLTSDTSKVVLMKIAFAQHDFHGDGISRTVLGQCLFYIAYNSRQYKFYRLGGFDSSDAKEFFAELEPQEFIMLTSDQRITREIDLLCLSERVKKFKSPKRKKKECVANCNGLLSSYLHTK